MPAPLFPAGIQSFVRTMGFLCITPAVAGLQYEYDPAQHSLIVNSLFAAGEGEKGRRTSISSFVNQTRYFSSVIIPLFLMLNFVAPKIVKIGVQPLNHGTESSDNYFLFFTLIFLMKSDPRLQVILAKDACVLGGSDEQALWLQSAEYAHV